MKYILVLISIVVVSSCSSEVGDFDAKVVGISDGDTLKVLVDGNKQVKIRLSGIDCPESKQPWGQVAKQTLSDTVFGHTVAVKPVNTDRRGMLVATIYKGRINVNRFLVGSGHCWVYPGYARDSELFKLHNSAKSKNLGLWSMPSAEIIEPWNFRDK